MLAPKLPINALFALCFNMLPIAGNSTKPFTSLFSATPVPITCTLTYLENVLSIS